MIDKELIKEKEKLDNLAQDDIQEANTYFREILKQSTLISTIIISFFGFFFESAYNGEPVPPCLGILGIISIIFLITSLGFGITQFLIDYQHARKWAHFRYELSSQIVSRKVEKYEEYYKTFHKEHTEKGMKIESKTYPLYLQLLFMGLGVLFFVILIILIIVT